MRADIEEVGVFVDVYVSTPLAECEKQDKKELYRSARAGNTVLFTGVSDPYEVPRNPNIQVDMSVQFLDVAANDIFSKLEEIGLIA